MRSLIAPGVVALCVFAGCHASGDVCGPTTVLVDGVCQPKVRCGSGTVDVGGVCTVPDQTPACRPSCFPGQQCGDDGCGGSCGSCDAASKYCVGGVCAADCTPACDGRVCGDDGCGGSCGSCPGAGETCSGNGRCVPATWACPLAAYGDGIACDCGCGAPDPDCGSSTLPVRGCALAGATCDAQGLCQGGVARSNWSCAPDTFADGRTCDCHCGVPDPDCQNPALPVLGCGPRGECGADGECVVCQPKCDGRVCGDDGCGGSCGSCPDPAHAFCTTAGQCSVCVPDCVGKNCGDDGCGGSCGSCGDGDYCLADQCAPLPDEASCAGHCGDAAPAGCSCAPDCAVAGTCCPDVQAICGCQPMCAGAACGDDGCGGSCGDCPSGTACVDHACLADPCSPDPCSGHGQCSATSLEAPAVCTCASGYTGAACDACAAGYTGYPACAKPLCSPGACSGHGTCQPQDGSCQCDPGFRGPDCSLCYDGHGTYPACSAPRCGDGILDPGEACDDGGNADGDGCSATCHIEAGYVCRNAVNLNTGSDGIGGQAPVGADDHVWTWSETPDGPQMPTVVSGDCAPGSWIGPASYAQWLDRNGCAKPALSGTTAYYHATFYIPTAEAAAATALAGTVWADNRISDILVNGVSTGVQSQGDIGFNGAGISFGAWPSSLYKQGRNDVTVAVYNAIAGTANSDGLLVELPNAFGAGSICLPDPCQPNPCGAGGSCTSNGSCLCRPGFAGDLCDSCDAGDTGYPSCHP